MWKHKGSCIPKYNGYLSPPNSGIISDGVGPDMRINLNVKGCLPNHDTSNGDKNGGSRPTLA